MKELAVTTDRDNKEPNRGEKRRKNDLSTNCDKR